MAATSIKLSDKAVFAESAPADKALLVKSMAAEILYSLHAAGWTLLKDTDVPANFRRTSWFFRKSGCVVAQAMMTFGLANLDSFHIIGIPPEMIDALVENAGTHYKLSILSKAKLSPDSILIKLEGKPWSNLSHEDKWMGRELIFRIFVHLENHGFTYYGSGDPKGTADSLFFIQEREVDGCSRNYFVMALDDQNKFFFLDAPQRLYKMVTACITSKWTTGIATEGVSKNLYEYRLKGKPWLCDGADVIAARKMLISILEKFQEEGFEVHAALDMYRSKSEKSLFVFRSIPVESQMKLTYACIGLNAPNKIQLINFMNSTYLIDSIRSVLLANWPKGIDLDEKKHGVHEFRLNGKPWMISNHGDAFCGRTLLCAVLEILENHGWRMMIAADLSSKSETGEACWFCSKPAESNLMSPGEDDIVLASPEQAA